MRFKMMGIHKSDFFTFLISGHLYPFNTRWIRSKMNWALLSDNQELRINLRQNIHQSEFKLILFTWKEEQNISPVLVEIKFLSPDAEPGIDKLSIALEKRHFRLLSWIFYSRTMNQFKKITYYSCQCYRQLPLESHESNIRHNGNIDDLSHSICYRNFLRTPLAVHERLTLKWNHRWTKNNSLLVLVFKLSINNNQKQLSQISTP